MIGYLACGLAALAVLAAWHVALRYAPPRGGRSAALAEGPAHAMAVIAGLARTVDRLTDGDPAHMALLLAELVRAKRPGDELTMSRRMLDLLDEAAELVHAITHPDLIPPAVWSTDSSLPLPDREALRAQVEEEMAHLTLTEKWWESVTVDGPNGPEEWRYKPETVDPA